MQDKEQTKNSQNESEKDVKTQISQAKVTKITAISRMSVKVRENFYTIEYQEERSLPEITDSIQMDYERKALFEDVNRTVDNQIAEIVKGLE